MSKKQESKRHRAWDFFRAYNDVFIVITIIYVLFFPKTPWFHEILIFRPLHMFLALWIFLALVYLSFPYAYLKWHLSIIFFPLRIFPYFRRTFALTEEDKKILRHLHYSVYVDKSGNIKPSSNEWMTIFAGMLVVYLQLFVWIRAILYHLFGWKIFPHVLNIPALIPWG